jgi:hypothetical protein
MAGGATLCAELRKGKGKKERRRSLLRRAAGSRGHHDRRHYLPSGTESEGKKRMKM